MTRGNGGNARHRRDVADEVEAEVRVERRIDGVCRDRQHQRVAVGRRPDDELGADIAGGARPVLDDERLFEPFRQPLRHQPRDDVGRAAGDDGDDQTHRPRRIGLRPRDPRDDRQRGSARGQMQEFATGKFHGDDPSLVCSQKDGTSQHGKNRRSIILSTRLMTGRVMNGPRSIIGGESAPSQ
jgi:hypothetical protein